MIGNDAIHELPCGILFTGPDGRITALNRPLQQWIGYSESALVGKRRFNDLLSIGGKIYFETHHRPLLDLQGEVRELNYELVDADGHRHPVLVNARRRDGAVPGFIYTIVPFHDRRKFEHELRLAQHRAEAANRAKATFLSTMSHEIRTPLHAILEAGNFLGQEAPRPDQLELINVLRTAGNNLLTIVNDILDISKMESGKLVLDRAPFQPTNLLQQMESTYRRLCQQRGLQLRVGYPEHDPPLVLGDLGKLTQVLNNLVSNAVKFTDEGNVTVNLEVRPDGDHHFLDFTVRDTGMGIGPERLEAIFEPFTQAESSIEGQFGGTGLGLAICQRIVRAHGAKLSVASELGRGTTFSFTLHLPEADPQSATAPVRARRPEQLPSLAGLRLLNVDDSAANLLINARYFKAWNIDFRQARSGAEALELLETESFGLVLLDLKMPVMNGYELARRIRSHHFPSVRELPLIALTASASRAVNERMASAGINQLVLKPFESADLHRILSDHARDVVHEPPPAPSFDLTVAREIFDDDPESYVTFLRTVRGDMAELTREIRQSAEVLDTKRYEAAVHKCMTALKMFGLDRTLEDLNRGQELLVRDDRKAALQVVGDALRVLRVFTAYLEEVTAPSLK